MRYKLAALQLNPISLPSADWSVKSRRAAWTANAASGDHHGPSVDELKQQLFSMDGYLDLP